MATFATTQSTTVEVPVELTVRESRKNPDTVVVGVKSNGESKRAVLVRVLPDGNVRVRTLNGNPREASSNSDTQSVFEFSLDELTPDA